MGSWLDWKKNKNGVVGARMEVDKLTASVRLKIFRGGTPWSELDGWEVKSKWGCLSWRLGRWCSWCRWPAVGRVSQPQHHDVWNWIGLCHRRLSCAWLSCVSTREMPVALLQWWQPKVSSDIVRCLLRGQKSSQVENHCQMIAHSILVLILWVWGYYEARVTKIRIRSL